MIKKKETAGDEISSTVFLFAIFYPLATGSRTKIAINSAVFSLLLFSRDSPHRVACLLAVIAEISMVAASSDLYLQATYMRNELDKIIGVTGGNN